MTLRDITIKTLRHYWRTNLCLVAGVALCSAVITGALIVGDSIDASLRKIALFRIGNIATSFTLADRHFRSDLSTRMNSELSTPNAVVSILTKTGSAKTPSGEKRANRVSVLGVATDFWGLGFSQKRIPLKKGEVALNATLARQLDVAINDEVIVRVPKTGNLPAGSTLSVGNSATLGLRARVVAVLGDEDFGRYSLRAQHLPPNNAFVDITWLQDRLELEGKSNTLLSTLPRQEATTAMNAFVTLEDLELKQTVRETDVVLTSDRVFIDSGLTEQLLMIEEAPRRTLTWFVNAIETSERSTPYSMVAALNGPIIPSDMPKDGIILNKWLASDLKASKGDDIVLRYLTTTDGIGLQTNQARFVVHDVTAMKGAAIESTLSPVIPGLTDADNCQDWDADLPIDRSQLRDKDQDYWEKYGALPKAFIRLDRGQSLWSNPYGDVSAIHLQSTNTAHKALHALTPPGPGFVFHSIRDEALRGVDNAFDFRGLFLGFSAFLIGAAMMLITLLFSLGMQQRSQQSGVLVAIGFRETDIRRIFMREAWILAGAGSAIGVGLGVGYAQLVLHALSSIWQGAVKLSTVTYHAETSSLLVGFCASIVVALISIRVATKRTKRSSTIRLLQAATEMVDVSPSALLKTQRTLIFTSTALVIIAVGTLVCAMRLDHATAQMMYVGAGFVVLLLAICLSRLLLNGMTLSPHARGPSIMSLSFRSLGRKADRSMTIISLLSISSFIILTMDAYQHRPSDDTTNRLSGTGGFAFIAETAIPVFADPESPAFRELAGLNEARFDSASLIPLRVLDGDDASCLNLNQAQRPRLLSVNSGYLSKRSAFSFTSLIDDSFVDDPWSILEQPLKDGSIPVVSDQATLTWGLHKSLGETIELIHPDGSTLLCTVVGITAMTFLQGNLITSDQHFLNSVSSDTGHQAFLVDADPAVRQDVAATVTRSLADYGVEFVSTQDRLSEFMEVENTYMKIFQALGGIGLLLGLAGLGIVTARNISERRHEFGAMMAIGFRQNQIMHMVQMEHWSLIFLGLLAGLSGSIVALWPMLTTASLPVSPLLATSALIALNGMFWTWVAIRATLNCSALEGLRDE